MTLRRADNNDLSDALRASISRSTASDDSLYAYAILGAKIGEKRTKKPLPCGGGFVRSPGGLLEH